MKCTICGGDTLKNIDKTKQLLNDQGILSEMVNPGGRTIEVKHKGKLHLIDMCNSCDDIKIIKFLAG